MSGGDEPLLDARLLAKSYPVRRGAPAGASGRLAALGGVSLAIGRRETLGLVGESGSGKSTIARILLRFEEPDSGAVAFDGGDWLALGGAELRAKRRDIQIVFQDPATALHPRLTVGTQIAEPLRVQRIARGRELRERVDALLADVGLSPAVARRYPAEFSGGQRQRIAIARALATGPKLLVCDEPVSALDVSVAAQVLNLFADLRERRGLASLFISHDLAVVARVADRIAVLYAGRIVEQGETAALVAAPLHPYTAALLDAADPASKDANGRAGRGRATDDARRQPGCAFAPRCPIASDRCRAERPELASADGSRAVACFHPGELPRVETRGDAARPPI